MIRICVYIVLLGAIPSCLHSPIRAEGAEILPLPSSGKASSGNYRITGELQRGDFERFLNIAVSRKERPNSIWITSPGGSVEEALKFGRFAEKMLMSCVATEKCNSSCFLIIAGCVDRTVAVDIGIHRPYFRADEFGNLPFDEAKTQYQELLTAIQSYLQEIGVPGTLIDQMVSVPSESVKYLSPELFKSHVGKRAPAYHEWLKAKCGVMSDTEKADLEKVTSGELFKVLKRRVQTHEMDEEARESLEYTRRMWNIAQTMPEGYRAYLLRKKDELHDCESKAIRNEADLRWRRLMGEYTPNTEKGR